MGDLVEQFESGELLNEPGRVHGWAGAAEGSHGAHAGHVRLILGLSAMCEQYGMPLRHANFLRLPGCNGGCTSSGPWAAARSMAFVRRDACCLSVSCCAVRLQPGMRAEQAQEEVGGVPPTLPPAEGYVLDVQTLVCSGLGCMPE